MRKLTHSGIPSLKPKGRRLQRDIKSGLTKINTKIKSPDLVSTYRKEATNNTLIAFTLIELIVVIIILAILGTIAFIAMQGYSKDARDSTRISDVSKIISSLELYHVDSGKYPDPTETQPVTYSGQLAWYQGTFGNSTFINVEKLDKIPLDPLTDKEYAYSLLNNKQEFQLGGIMEGDEYGMNSPHPNPLPMGEGIAQAEGEKTARALVRGTYNGMAMRVNSSTTSYILAVPSIITSLDLSVEGSDNRKLDYILNSKELVLNGYKNLPNNYINSQYITNSETTNSNFSLVKDNNVTNSIIYEGDVTNLTSQVLVDKLKQAYAGTTIEDSGEINELLNLDTIEPTKMEEADNFGVSFINYHLGGSAVNKIYATCGGIAHNTTMTYYSTGSVDFGQTCESVGIDFTCIDGTWIDQVTSLNIANYPETECVVEQPLSCEYLGMPLDHGDSLTVYSKNTIAWDSTENCTDGLIEGTVTCNNGTLDGNNTYGSLTCTKGTPSNCEEEVKVIGEHSYDIPALNHAGTGTYIDDIPEYNGVFRYTYNAICNDGTITGTETGPELQSCNTNYTMEDNTCKAYCGASTFDGYSYSLLLHTQTQNVNKDTSPANGNQTTTATLTCTDGNIAESNVVPGTITCNTGYFLSGGSCLSQWTGDGTTDNGYTYRNTSGTAQYPTSCNDLLLQTTWKNTLYGSPWNGSSFLSGMYRIKTDSDSAFRVHCDMTTDGGGWTMIANYYNGSYFWDCSDTGQIYGTTCKATCNEFADDSYLETDGINRRCDTQDERDIQLSEMYKIRSKFIINNDTQKGTTFFNGDTVTKAYYKNSFSEMMLTNNQNEYISYDMSSYTNSSMKDLYSSIQNNINLTNIVQATRTNLDSSIISTCDTFEMALQCADNDGALTSYIYRYYLGWSPAVNGPCWNNMNNSTTCGYDDTETSTSWIQKKLGGKNNEWSTYIAWYVR